VFSQFIEAVRIIVRVKLKDGKKRGQRRAYITILRQKAKGIKKNWTGIP
jgi:hypothetical protein